MTLLQALELIASLIPGFGPAVRALRLLRIAVRIAELVRRRVNGATAGTHIATDASLVDAQWARELSAELVELERAEREPANWPDGVEPSSRVCGRCLIGTAPASLIYRDRGTNKPLCEACWSADVRLEEIRREMMENPPTSFPAPEGINGP